MYCREIVFTNGIWVSFGTSSGISLYEMYLPQFGYKAFNMLKMEYYDTLRYYARSDYVIYNNLCNISCRFRSLSKLTGQFITVYLKVI